LTKFAEKTTFDTPADGTNAAFGALLVVESKSDDNLTSSLAYILGVF